MNSNIITAGILKALGILFGIFMLFFFFYKIQTILVYIAIAVIISLISRPVIGFLKKRLRLPINLAVIITMILFIATFSGIIAMFVPLIIKQSENLALLDIEQLQINVEKLLSQTNDYFLTHDIDIISEFKNLDIFSGVKKVPNILNTLLGTIGDFGIGLFSVIFIAFFFMKDTHLVEDSIYVMVNTGNENKVRRSMTSIKSLLSRYFIGLVFQILAIFILYTLILLIFNIENAVVIAFLCALLNLIPFLGPVIGGLLMMFLTMSSNLGQDFQDYILPTTIYVMIGFTIAQIIDNFISQPYIFSNSVKSHPLEIFLVILISGVLFGVVGMIVAVPSYTVIKVVLKEFLSENKIVKSLTKNLR